LQYSDPSLSLSDPSRSRREIKSPEQRTPTNPSNPIKPSCDQGLLGLRLKRWLKILSSGSNNPDSPDSPDDPNDSVLNCGPGNLGTHSGVTLIATDTDSLYPDIELTVSEGNNRIAQETETETDRETEKETEGTEMVGVLGQEELLSCLDKELWIWTGLRDMCHQDISDMLHTLQSPMPPSFSPSSAHDPERERERERERDETCEVRERYLRGLIRHFSLSPYPQSLPTPWLSLALPYPNNPNNPNNPNSPPKTVITSFSDPAISTNEAHLDKNSILTRVNIHLFSDPAAKLCFINIEIFFKILLKKITHLLMVRGRLLRTEGNGGGERVMLNGGIPLWLGSLYNPQR